MRVAVGQDGVARIAVPLASGDVLTIGLNALDGVAFVAETEVDIPDARLLAAAEKLAAPFGGLAKVPEVVAA